MPQPILIAGAGIGGLTAAIALKRAGHEVRVFERAPELAPVGAGVLLQRNALQALKHLGLMDEAIAAGEPVRRLETSDPEGDPLLSMEPASVWGDVAVSMVAFHRADLHRMLLEAAGDVVSTGAAVTGVEELGDRVRVTLENGDTHEGELLIGADGLRSVVRNAVLGDEPLRYSGQTSWRAIAPGSSMVPSGVSNETLGTKLRFGYVKLSRERAYWYAVQSAPAGGRQTPDETRSHLLALFGHWHAPIRALIESTPPELIVRTDIADRPPTGTWGRGRITLLGDAAHPMTPNLGQGACQAIEDAVVLGDALKHTGHPVAALRAYEARRIPRANQFVVDSRRMGKLLHVEHGPLASVRNWVVRMTPRSAMTKRIQQIGRFELE